MTPRRAQPAPKLEGVPREAADEIRSLAQTVYRLTARIQAMESAGYLTVRQAEERYSPPVMAQQLSATGSAPLNVVTIGGTTILQAQPVRKRG